MLLIHKRLKFLRKNTSRISNNKRIGFLPLFFSFLFGAFHVSNGYIKNPLQTLYPITHNHIFHKWRIFVLVYLCWIMKTDWKEMEWKQSMKLTMKSCYFSIFMRFDDKTAHESQTMTFALSQFLEYFKVRCKNCCRMAFFHYWSFSVLNNIELGAIGRRSFFYLLKK